MACLKKTSTLRMLSLTVAAAAFHTPAVNAAIIQGFDNGGATIEEVVDYNCKHCAYMQPYIDALVDNDTRIRVRVMPTAKPGESATAARAAYIVAKYAPEHFGDYNNALLGSYHTPVQAMALLKPWKLDTPAHRVEMGYDWVSKSITRGQQVMHRHPGALPLLVVYPSLKPTDQAGITVFHGKVSTHALQAAVNKAYHVDTTNDGSQMPGVIDSFKDNAKHIGDQVSGYLHHLL